MSFVISQTKLETKPPTPPKGKSNLLRGGHAPGFLRGLLGEALENASPYPWPDSWVEALDDELGQNHIYGQHLAIWMAMTKPQRARWLTSCLWHCTDIMPSQMCAEMDLPSGATYARAARRLRRRGGTR
jgi:hypothetical protein